MEKVQQFLMTVALFAAAVPAWSNALAENGSQSSSNPERKKASARSAMVQKPAMLDRFLRYVAVESGSQTPTYPITPGQIEMANLLKSDAEALGAKVVKTEWQYVYVDIPANIDKDVPILGFSCHLDYTPEVPGKGIKPTVLEYTGGDIVLADGSVISPVNPDGEDLPQMVGKTLIHTDGTTLLGGDDKNGCTILMSLIETLTNPSAKHGRVQIVFCPNEDVGGAADYIDSSLFFPDILFDVDCPGGSRIMDSNFTAHNMEVRFIGKPAHPAEAKAKGLGDALAAAATYIASVPLEYRPERTEGTEGYIQHYAIEIENGGIDYKVPSRIRYFDKAEGELLDKIVMESLDKIHRDFPFVKTEIIFDGIIYDNIAYSLHPASRSVVEKAAAKAGVPVNFLPERGGTTASMFVTKGLIGGMGIFAGGHNEHSVHEYSCLDEMMDSYHLLINIVDEVSKLVK